MSQDMSTFFTGVRRHPQDRVPKTRTGAQGVQGNRKRRPQNGAGEGARAGAGVVAAFDRRRPVAVTRLTGGGPIPTGIFQSTAPEPRPPTMVSMGAPRRFRQIEWIMKPSKSFVQCSESSSEDCRPNDGVLELQKPKGRTSSSSSSSNSSSSKGCSGASESQSKARLESTNLSQKLVKLLKSSCRPEEPLVRAKKRTSRVFCVPTQRIMHSEELLQAQLLQMRPRRNKLMQRYSHNPTSRILSKSFKETVPASPRNAFSRNASPKDAFSRNASPRNTSPRNTSPKDASPIHQALEKTLVQSNETVNPYLASLPALPQPSQSGDHPLTRSHSQAGDQPSTSSHSSCSIEKAISTSPISSPSSSSCPSQITLVKPAARSNCSINSNSSNNSSLSTSGTECSVERMTPRYRGTGFKAIKLTSTVIKIMPKKAKRGKHLSKSKLRSRTNSLGQKKAPASPSIAPPLKVSKLSVGQSLTAQLRKAVGEDLLPSAAKKKKDLATPKEDKETLKLDRKTSIYLIMDQARPDQIRDEPLTTKSDWVIQPIKQQMISAAQDQAKKDGSERLNPYMSDSIGHNYDIYINTSGDRGDPEARAPGGKCSRKQPLPTPSRIPSRSAFHNQTLLPPSDGFLRSRPRTQRSSLITQPVSLNRIPRPRVPAVPVPDPQQQPRQMQQPLEVVTAGAGGKIVRKAQHKVPRTMEDGIDMSYQYFVSIPLKRGRKPQVVRYLYRPMVRHLNGVPPANRRSSRRAKRRRTAAGSEKLEKSQQKLDPDLVALGGAPLPLEDAPKDEAEAKELPKKRPTLIYDPEAAPYKVPPLKLKSCYMPMLEQLEQMPFPDDRLNRKRRCPQRRARAVGGSEQLPPPPTEFQDHQPLQSLGGGGGDVMAEDEGHHTPVIVWSGRPAHPVPRTSVVNYQAKPTRLCTATGAPILYHQPLLLTLKEVDCKPMIRTITYESIEEEDDDDEEEWELRLEKQQVPEKVQQEQDVMPKSVSFHPEPVFVSRGSTSAFQGSSSSSSSSSSISSSSIVATRSQSKKGKGKRSPNKGKGKNRGKGKAKGRK